MPMMTDSKEKKVVKICVWKEVEPQLSKVIGVKLTQGTNMINVCLYITNVSFTYYCFMHGIFH